LISFDIVLLWLDLIGVFFFAVSGSLLAARKQFDFVDPYCSRPLRRWAVA